MHQRSGARSASAFNDTNKSPRTEAVANLIRLPAASIALDVPSRRAAVWLEQKPVLVHAARLAANVLTIYYSEPTPTPSPHALCGPAPAAALNGT